MGILGAFGFGIFGAILGDLSVHVIVGFLGASMGIKGETLERIWSMVPERRWIESIAMVVGACALVEAAQSWGII